LRGTISIFKSNYTTFCFNTCYYFFKQDWSKVRLFHAHTMVAGIHNGLTQIRV